MEMTNFKCIYREKLIRDSKADPEASYRNTNGGETVQFIVDGSEGGLAFSQGL